MGERPTGFEIDRKDAAGNYEPDNCQWLLKRTNRQYRTATKLTPDVRASIDELHSKGMFHRQIAAEIGVSKSAVSDYLRGDHW